MKRAVSRQPRWPRIQATGEQLWQTAEDVFHKYAQDGAELVIALRIGPYTDVDYDELIQHHLDHRCQVTMAVDPQGAALDLFVLSACSRQDAVTLLRSGLRQLRRECKRFPRRRLYQPAAECLRSAGSGARWTAGKQFHTAGRHTGQARHLGGRTGPHSSSRPGRRSCICRGSCQNPRRCTAYPRRRN